MELSSRSCDGETSRNGQLRLLAELRGRECAHEEALVRVSEGVEEIRNGRVLKQNCVMKKACVDGISQNGGDNLGEFAGEPVHSQPIHASNQEQQEVVRESQDVTDLEIATSSGSVHVPSKPYFLFRLSSCSCFQ